MRKIVLSAAAAALLLSASSALAANETGWISRIDRDHHLIWFHGTKVRKMTATPLAMSGFTVGDRVAVFYSVKNGKAVVRGLIPDDYAGQGFTDFFNRH